MTVIQVENIEDKINEILEIVQQIASGEYHKRLSISDRNDDLDALSVGINMLTEELEAKIEEQSKQNQVLQKMLQDVAREKQRSEEHLNELEKQKKMLVRYSKRLKEANKDLDAFAYSVSHDLRAPLRAINGFSKALVDNYSENIDEEMKHYIERINAGAEKMAELIDNILRFSRQTREDINPEDVKTEDLIYKIIENQKEIEKQRNINFSVRELHNVIADKTMIEVIFSNLIGNAVKYTSKKEKAEIEIGSKIVDDEVEFYVKDNGAGFDMAYSDKLFAAFQRLHTDNEFQGSGIGLSTVKKLVNKHGGRIWAEGEEDKGAIFHFTLPRKYENRE